MNVRRAGEDALKQQAKTGEVNGPRRKSNRDKALETITNEVETTRLSNADGQCSKALGNAQTRI